jgi:GT2 family glycosyltransferase
VPAERAPTTADLVSIVIVVADSGGEASECAAKVLRSTLPVEVIVVDNASSDGGIERVAERFVQDRRVRILRNESNIGFGPACNRGVGEARGNIVVLLNPDCLIDEDVLARLRAAIEADTSIGLAGVVQVDARGRIDPASRRRDPLLRRALASVSGLERFASHWPALAGVYLPSPSTQAAAIETVDAVSGALMALPRRVFERVGGFDEGYFLHCEDLDLCRRVRDAGWRVVCANDIRAVHAKGGSSRHRPLFVAWHKRRSMWRWFTRFDPAARNPLLRGVVWCGIWGAFAASVPLLLLRRLFARAA